MRILSTLALAVALSASAFALPITITDATGSTPGDVFGDPNKFDVKSLTINSYDSLTKMVSVQISFNYGGGAGLNAFGIGYPFNNLNVGDMFFWAGSNTYAVALKGHSGLTAGNFYQATSTQTAQQVLGIPTGWYANSYRPNETVWATSGNLIGAGTVNTLTNGGPNSLLVNLNFKINDAVAANLNNGFTVGFASATCGNDILRGTVGAGNFSNVPEPATYMLMSAGLVGVAMLKRRMRA